MEQVSGIASPSIAGSSSRRLAASFFWVTAFGILTAVGAWLEIPLTPVPITLQTFFVLLAGATLGMRRGAMSQVVYLLAGAIGFPVFAGFIGGIMKLAGPTGGYLLSFPVAAFVTAAVIRNRDSFGWYLAGTTLGSLVIFICGTVQLWLVYTHNLPQAFVSGFLIFSWWDALKIVAVSAIAWNLRRVIR
jgi:biotin transport system substrate-specific component